MIILKHLPIKENITTPLLKERGRGEGANESKERVKFFLFTILFSLFTIQLFSQPINRPFISSWQFSKAGDASWYKAEVPGTVHTDLMANKLIPDPFYRDNEKKVQWVE